MAKSKIAVLLSAYNGEEYIEEQIESIFAQDLSNPLTLFVRNDGSTDDTACVLTRLAESHPNLEIINGDNIGLVASFFELLSVAYKKDYDYFSFSDHDDFWLPDKLRIALERMNEGDNSTPLLYASSSFITDEELNKTGSETGKQLRPITFFNTAIQNFCPGHNQVINRALAEEILKHTKNTKNIYSQDLWITNVAALTGTIFFDNESHTLYRQHQSNQLSYGKSRLNWALDHIRRLKKNEGTKIALQLRVLVRFYSSGMDKEQKREMARFFRSQSSFMKRLAYVLNCRLYRQKKMETWVFKFLYLVGSYRA